MFRVALAATLLTALSTATAMSQGKVPANDEACTEMLGRVAAAIGSKDLPEDWLDRIQKLFETAEDHCNNNRFAEAHKAAVEIRKLIDRR